MESKFVNIFKKMVSFWQQYFFRNLIESGIVNKRNMPIISEADADDDEDEQSEPEEPDNVTAFPAGEEEKEVSEDLITAATQLVRHENKATMSLLQRRLNIGYAEAGRLIQVLEDRGIVGPYNGPKPREVLPYDVPQEG